MELVINENVGYKIKGDGTHSNPLTVDDSDLFAGGVVSWRETYFEVVSNITESRDRHEGLRKIQLNHGRTGFWELAKEMTDKFEKKNKDTDWDSEDYDFYDMVDEFCISYFDTL